MKTRFITLFLLVTFWASQSAYAEGQLLDRVVAVVNDDAITQTELDMYLHPIYEQMKTQYQGAELADRVDETRKKLLGQLIEDRLVFQKAKEMKLEIGESDLKNELDHLKKQFGSELSFEDNINKEGFSLSALKDRLNRQLMIRRLQDMEVRAKVIVSPLELENYYKDHLSDYISKSSIKTCSMTLKKGDQAREKGLTDESAKKKIEDFHERVVAGEDFGKLAMANSEDYQAAQGGLSDWIQPGSLIPVIDDVIFKLKVHELSPIIETPMGYHFFRVEEKKEAKEKKFEEVRDEIFETLYRAKAKNRFEDWMDQLKRDAYISLR